MPLSNIRFGVETIYANHRVLLVKRNDTVGIPEVLEALSEERTIEIVRPVSDYIKKAGYFIAYTLENHVWIFGELSGDYDKNITQDSLAREISEKLNVQAFSYHQSDGRGFVNYNICENGFVTEFFGFYDGEIPEDTVELSDFCEQPNVSKLLALDEDSMQDYEGNIPFEYNCFLYSVSRQITIEDLIDDEYVIPRHVNPYYFVAKTMERLKIYIPISNPRLISNGKLLDAAISTRETVEDIKCQDIMFAQIH